MFLDNVWPKITALCFDEGGKSYAVLCREGTYIEPRGGWIKKNRRFKAIEGFPPLSEEKTKVAKWLANLPTAFEPVVHEGSCNETSFSSRFKHCFHRKLLHSKMS